MAIRRQGGASESEGQILRLDRGASRGALPGLPRAEPASLPQGTGPPLQGLPGQRIADTVRAATELSSVSQGEAAELYSPSQGEAADISNHCPANRLKCRATTAKAVQE